MDDHRAGSSCRRLDDDRLSSSGAQDLGSKSAKNLSMSMLICFSSGVLLWLIYGLLIDSLPIILTNAVTLMLAGANLALKIKYD